jgi:N-acetylglucosamine-6-phosphate deacetylase
MLITHARILTLAGVIADGWLHCADGKIAALGDGTPPAIDDSIYEAGGNWLLPGMIDLHVHGAVGRDTMDANADGLRAMARCYAQHGVTGFLATTWTDSRPRIHAALTTIAAHSGRIAGGATLLGAHLEGPYLNPVRCGAQDSTHIRRADREEATAFLDYGVIRLLALAPEYPENEWLIEACVQRGITVSAAHTDATYSQMQRAVTLGVTQTTHTFNAMRPLHQREPGTLGAALTLPELRCELIADNVHVHPVTQAILWQAKGRDHVILISDAVRAAGMAQGSRYLQDGRETVVRDAAYLADGTLAGSSSTLDTMVAKFMAATGAALPEVWVCVSRNPARAIGMDDRKGSIVIGMDADLIVMDDALTVQATIIAGESINS